MPFLKRVSFVLLTVSCLAASTLDAQRELTERHVFITVTGPKGAPVTTLTPKDVVVREDDVAREIIRIGDAPPPSHLVLLVDNTAETQTFLQDLRSGILSVARQMNQQSTPPMMMLMTVAERPTRVVDFTTSDIAIENGVKTMFARPGSGAYMLDAIVQASAALRKAEATRPAIMAFVLETSAEFSNVNHMAVADALRDAGASLWTITLQGRVPGGSLEVRERANVTGDVTEWSGGLNTPVLSRNGLAAAFTSATSAMLGRLDVTYGRPSSLVPPSRVSVELRDRTLRLSAPRWPGR